MKINKSSYKYWLFPFISIQLISCNKDYLETPPTSNITRQSYVNSLQTSEDFLMGLYVKLSSDVFHGLNTAYPELVSDNIKPVQGNTSYGIQYKWTQTASEDRPSQPGTNDRNMNAIWTGGYGIIRGCSYLLENIDKYREENPSKCDNLKGQALALRALVHHQLVNIFAQPYKYSIDASHPGIPYITTSDWTQPVTRSTVAQVYNAIIEDLNASIELISNSSGTNVLNRNSAKALLSRVFLFKGDYLSAKSLAREISALVPIMTGPNYPSKLFTLQETEALFQLPPALSSLNNANYSTNYASVFFKSPSLRFVSTNSLASILTERQGDVRKAWVTLTSGSWNVTKFPTGVVTGFSNPAGSYYLTVIRSSELYLTTSECYAKIGNEDSARFYLDAIRKRADATILATTAVGNALLDSIYKERRKELSFEGFRLFDLLRAGKDISRTDASNSAPLNLPYPSPKAIAPIPQLDIKLMGIDQNNTY